MAIRAIAIKNFHHNSCDGNYYIEAYDGSVYGVDSEAYHYLQSEYINNPSLTIAYDDCNYNSSDII